MFCKYCGENLIDRVEYCSKCGNKINDSVISNETQYNIQTVNEISKTKYIHSLRVLSIIGIVIFSFGLYYYSVYYNNYEENDEDAVGFFTFLVFGYALAFSIVSLVQGNKNNIRTIKVMSIISIILISSCVSSIYSLLYEEYYTALDSGIIGVLYLIAFSIVVLVKGKRFFEMASQV